MRDSQFKQMQFEQAHIPKEDLFEESSCSADKSMVQNPESRTMEDDHVGKDNTKPRTLNNRAAVQTIDETTNVM